MKLMTLFIIQQDVIYTYINKSKNFKLVSTKFYFKLKTSPINLSKNITMRNLGANPSEA